MQATQHRSFQTPDETRAFPNGRAEIIKLGEVRSVDRFGARNYAKQATAMSSERRRL